MRSFGDLRVAEQFDSDDDLQMGGEYVPRGDAEDLYDFLGGLLGKVTPTPQSATAPGMSRAEALKLAEDTVGRMAPTINVRGYSDGIAPLGQRTEAILSLARFLMASGA